jgi:hypothetical protein
MKVLKPVYCTITEYLMETIMVSKGFFHPLESQKVPAKDPHVVLWVYLKKPASQGRPCDYAFRIEPFQWYMVRRKMEGGEAVMLGASKERVSGDELFFYHYKGQYYMAKIQLDVNDVALMVDEERTALKEKLTKEVERVKARAEAEGGVRQPIPEDVQILVWNRDHGMCVKCGSKQNLEFDHIIPLSKGGSNTARNIQLLCEKCNRSKGANIAG